MFTQFAKSVPKTKGFYVLRYKEGHESKVYLEEPNHRWHDTYSYFAVYHNYRDKNTCHDMGQYVWVNNYSTYGGPIEWRKMEIDEALKFSNTLFRFGRPYWKRKEGRQPLTRKDVEEIQSAQREQQCQK